jgi:uncharacterized protein YodC (DUF2158 family)
MINVGDLVIKNTGGNKMKVISITNGIAECAWFTDCFNQSYFSLKELVPISEYDTIFKEFRRQERIDILLN